MKQNKYATEGVVDQYKPLRSKLAEHLSEKGICDPRVLNAIATVPRHCFVNRDFIQHAYDDRALPLKEGQTISQPFVVAEMTEATIKNKTIDKLLEVGTGSGYQSAVASMVADRVFTVERHESLYRETRERLHKLGYDNIHLRRADGSRGWSSFAPYDAIIVTAACREVPRLLLDQLADGGRLIAPVGDVPGSQTLTLVTRRNGKYRKSPLSGVRFVPLVEGMPT